MTGDIMRTPPKTPKAPKTRAPFQERVPKLEEWMAITRRKQGQILLGVSRGRGRGRITKREKD